MHNILETYARWQITPARGRSSSAPKTLAFLRAVEFGRARMAEPRASGPAALFALRAVFEAAVLIYGDVYDALKLFAQKARGSRGRDPEEPPLGGGDERPRACCLMARALRPRL